MVALLGSLLLSLAVSASAVSAGHSRYSRRHSTVASHHNSSLATRGHTYKLVERHEGKNFFDGFDFFTGKDPTSGLVHYVSRSQAQKLAYVQEDGTAVLSVDTSDTVPVGGNRKSVRISTRNKYSQGLFIADIYAMAHGCGVWPAYWSLGVADGVSWPDAGEIDIIEGINKNTRNQITMHSGTSAACLLDKAEHVLGDLMGTNCTSANGANAGCAALQEEGTFGHDFNTRAGGAYAHSLQEDGIRVWFWWRDQIPEDVKANKPDPSTWGVPQSFLSSATCDIKKLFFEQSLIFDTTICGDWAGGEYKNSGCPDTCEVAVSNPENFKYAKWMIASLKIYQ